MIVVENEKTAYFDVDDTLVIHHREDDPRAKEFVYDNGKYYYTFHLVPHEKHIEELKLLHRTGWEVIVWSQGGSKWEKSVVETLGIQEFVDVVLTKPVRFYDDLRPEEFMVARNYVPFK